jgi:hypothetical protein
VSAMNPIRSSITPVDAQLVLNIERVAARATRTTLGPAAAVLKRTHNTREQHVSALLALFELQMELPASQITQLPARRPIIHQTMMTTATRNAKCLCKF